MAKDPRGGYRPDDDVPEPDQPPEGPSGVGVPPIRVDPRIVKCSCRRCRNGGQCRGMRQLYD